MSERRSDPASGAPRTGADPQGVQPSEAADWPPEWTRSPIVDEQTRGIWAISPGGATTLAVWRQVPDSTEFDRSLVAVPFVFRPEVAVAQARALVEAAGRRPPGLAEDQWQSLLATVWPELTEEQKRSGDEILHAVRKRKALDEGLDELVDRHLRGTSGLELSEEAAAALRPQGPGRPPWTRRMFEDHWEAAFQETKKRIGRKPTIAEVAAHFQGLDGLALDPHHVLGLRRRWMRGKLPE